MSNLDDLIEAARQEHLALDQEIYDLREQRRQINAKIKALALRKTRTARIVLASQARTRKAKAVSDGG